MENNSFYADLHCHTTMSDSSVDPENVIALAKAAGLSAVAITDHDTFSGLKRSFDAAEKADIKMIPGIEFSSYDYERKRKVHILAYMFKHPEVLKPVCDYTSAERLKAGMIMLERVKNIYGIPEEMVLKYKKGPALYKQHIMHGLIDAGYADSIFGDTFRRLFKNEKESIEEKIPYPDVFGVIEKIREAGAVCVLAHPALYKSEELMEELTEKCLIDGIEVHHESAAPEKTEEFSSYAKEHGLIATGGTDFHGFYHKRAVPIGSFTADRSETEKLI